MRRRLAKKITDHSSRYSSGKFIKAMLVLGMLRHSDIIRCGWSYWQDWVDRRKAQ